MIMMAKLIHFGRNEIDLYRILLEFTSPFIREINEFLNDKNFGNQLSPFDRQELALLIVTYQKLNQILVEFSIAIDEFTFTIYRFVSSLIKQTFLKDLGIIETLIESEKFCNYNVLLKYNPLFHDTLRIITVKRPHCQTLFELFQVLQEKYMINIELEYDPFYQKIFTWITRGTLNSSLDQQSFFIQKSSLDSNTSLDLSKVPQQIDPINAIKIYDIGQSVRKITQINSKVKFFDANLFWRYYQKRMELYDITVLFRYFLADLANTVFTYIMKETSLKEDSMNFISHLKTFYLHGNELLWTNFLELKSIDDDGIRKAFNLALYRTFDDHEAETYQHLISIKERIIDNNHRQSLSTQNSNDMNFKITFRLPNLVKIVLTDKVWSKYQSIFTFLQKIKSIRWQLIEYWKRQVLIFKRKNHLNNVDKNCQLKSDQWFLLYSLIRFTGIFYTYVKFCIEYRMEQFFTNIKSVADIENIQKFHMSTLLAIINDLFIKNTFNFNLINRILDLSKQMMIMTTHDDLIIDYKQAMEIFRETIPINKSHSPFNELLMSI
ncbi:uncharacterized protein LOC113791303 [Dermatophagoides pteronyssinus]|uniref:Gamma-tubulin complex component n=1 Tax=Dermatophagoides pteronyssinus TaxID=6956 RepID=A0A6P6XTW0_DERPT|nr:uncharacterized protein LOC113791303 [Dermatophagoides pteronyssinus]